MQSTHLQQQNNKQTKTKQSNSNTTFTASCLILILYILVPPTAANMILMVDGVQYNNGDQVVFHEGAHNFQCSSTNARPTPEITRSFGATQVMEDNGSGPHNQ